jgi:hypothetical protein
MPSKGQKRGKMKKQELQEFRQEIEDAIQYRNALGEYDANAKHMNWLLYKLAQLTDHALEQYPKPVSKSKK